MSQMNHVQNSTKLASIGIVLGGALWGLFWLPVRAFEDLGFSGAWPGLLIYLSAFVVFIPLVIIFRSPVKSIRQLAIAGLLTGTAFSFYGTAIILTDVVRALLFFYLTPVWGTAIGVLFLGERLAAARVIAILMAFAGLFAVVGFGSRSAINIGDVMALIAGISWSIGTLKIYQMRDAPALHLSLAFIIGAIVVTLALVLFGGNALGGLQSPPPLATYWPYLFIAGLPTIPLVFLTIWPAKILSPGRIGILLMSEVVVGIGSVALFAGDPFGPFEALGAVLISAATLVEILGNKRVD